MNKAKKSSIETYQLNFNDVELLIAKFSRLEEMLDALTLPDPDLRMYSEAEVADMFGISPSTLQKLRLAGKVSYRQVGKRVLYNKKDILEFQEWYAVKRKK